VCQWGTWITFNDGRCFCTPPCYEADCPADSGGVCAKLDSGSSAVCIYTGWNLCTVQ
jgi:hypothetical protein